MKEKEHGLSLLGRHMPSNQPLPIARQKFNFFGLRKADVSWGAAKYFGRTIKQSVLNKIKPGYCRDVENDCNEQEFERNRHSGGPDQSDARER